MLFNSIQFVFFFVIVASGYFLIPHRFRVYLLLVSSYFFYMCWNTSYVLLLFVFTLVNYLSAWQIAFSSSKKHKDLWLGVSLLFSLGTLFIFKYFNFFLTSSQYLFLNTVGIDSFPKLNLLLPVGISFYTFQTLSYTIDVYRGVVSIEKNFVRFALYVSFFPQLVAGPIERASHLLGQFSKKHYFDYSRVKSGLLLMLWGFFQKVVIADRLAVYVNAVYNYPDKYEGITIWVATFFFAFQIYCDFSGYTDIARGSARILGYDLMPNFKRPYFAKTISDFWRRWHISLSTWLRDYLYIPLGGNRVHKSRHILNILIVFLLCGLWHGANWNYVVWGGLHGLFLIFGVMTISYRRKLAHFVKIAQFPMIHHMVRVSIVFSLVGFSWVFFRANSLSDAFMLINNAFTFNGDNKIIVQGGLSLIQMFLATILLIVLLVVNFIQEKMSVYELLNRQCVFIRWILYITIVFAIVIFGVYDNDLVEFIYFQF